MLELCDRELVVEEAVPKLQILPDVDFLPQKIVILQPCVVFNELSVEESLRDLDVTLVLDEHIESTEGLRHTIIVALIIFTKPIVRDARYQPD